MLRLGKQQGTTVFAAISSGRRRTSVLTITRLTAAIFPPTSPDLRNTHSKPLPARSPATPAAISRTPGTARRRPLAAFLSSTAAAPRRMSTAPLADSPEREAHTAVRASVPGYSWGTPNTVGIRRFPAFLPTSCAPGAVMSYGIPRGARPRSTPADICAHAASHATANANTPQTSAPTRSQQTPKCMCSGAAWFVPASRAVYPLCLNVWIHDPTSSPLLRAPHSLSCGPLRRPMTRLRVPPALPYRAERRSCRALRRRLSRTLTPPHACRGVRLGAPVDRARSASFSRAR
ncbi:hypothetical protein C8J57DRAFT_1536060 [Mycena rebaudengoi]|nr:hypothetical protein C8J57DRAFT_1536060 [Mycena rebaudengoi]